MKSFQNIIRDLQDFWSDKGCCILQPYDTEIGAGTSHPATVLRALGKKHWRCSYVQPCRRPKDGRYGKNPNRTQLYYQFQTLLKPAPEDSQKLSIDSLQAMGLNLDHHDIRFVEDDWENPTLGAAGLGWEIWCDGMEIVQYTYFQQVGGLECDPVSVEITYGLERIASIIQNVDSHFDLNWNGLIDDKKITYGDVFFKNEKQFSAYNFEHANVDNLFDQFKNCEREAAYLLEQELVLPAYEQCLKANHFFNLLDARGVIATTERAHYINRVRQLAKKSCELYVSQEKVA